MISSQKMLNLSCMDKEQSFFNINTLNENINYRFISGEFFGEEKSNTFSIKDVRTSTLPINSNTNIYTQTISYTG